MNRRTVLRSFFASLLLTNPLAAAQATGTRTVRLVVAFAPGGQSDLVARLLARTLGDLLDISMVVENRPGAGGAIGVEFVARAPADESTLLLGSASNLTIGPAVDASLRYDPIRDFSPIGRIARTPLVVAVRSGLPVTNVSELVEHARRHPGQLTYASGATLVQFAVESLKAAAGVDIMQVPYKGTAPALLDVVAGRVDLLVADVTAVAPHASSGALRVVANAGRSRARAFPDVPTMAEQGYDFDFESWQGLLAPGGTADETIARLQAALRQALASAEFVKGLEALGFEPIHEPPAAFAAFLRAELERYRRLARRQGDATSRTDPAADRKLN
jgi:tripartite-type tricarboxylate transporter receptor subunit TctC